MTDRISSVLELLHCWTGNKWKLYLQFIRNSQFVLERIVFCQKIQCSGLQTQENIREPYQLNTHKLIVGVAKGPLQNDLEMTFCHAILLSVPCNFHKNIKSFRKIQTVKPFFSHWDMHRNKWWFNESILPNAIIFRWLLQNIFFFDPPNKTEGASQHTSEDSINSFSGSSRKTHFEGSIPDRNVKPCYHSNIVPAYKI